MHNLPTAWACRISQLCIPRHGGGCFYSWLVSLASWRRWVLVILRLPGSYISLNIPDSFDNGAAARNSVAWCHRNVYPGAFRCGAWTPDLRSYAIPVVNYRCCHHHVICAIRRSKWSWYSFLLSDLCADLNASDPLDEQAENRPREHFWQFSMTS